MPRISVIVPTMRVGGLDLLFESLAVQRYLDYELVLVDGLYTRRAALVAEKAKEHHLAVRHLAPLDNPFPFNAFCRYANTGLALASGEIALFAVDYTWFPPYLLEKHGAFHRDNPGWGLMGPHRYYAPPDLAPGFGYGQEEIERYVSDLEAGRLDHLMWSTFAHSIKEATLDVDKRYGADPKLCLPRGEHQAFFFHGKNESCSLKTAIDANGWNEDLDGGHCYQDTEFAERLGLRWTIDPTMVVPIINPRHSFPFPRRPRSVEDNHAVWQAAKAAGYPRPTHRTIERLKP